MSGTQRFSIQGGAPALIEAPAETEVETGTENAAGVGDEASSEMESAAAASAEEWLAGSPQQGEQKHGRVQGRSSSTISIVTASLPCT